ncbi:MAG: HNH endonuclease [Microthrixaceae bacterium]
MNVRRKNGHRRTQLRKRVLAHYSACHLCGQPVDKTLPPNHPGAPEVDEIIPVSKGGSPLAWNNVALAHRLCNQQRGNRPIEDWQNGPQATPALPTSHHW